MMISAIGSDLAFGSMAKIKVNGSMKPSELSNKLNNVAGLLGKKYKGAKKSDKQLKLAQDELIISNIQKLTRRGGSVHVTIMDSEKSATKLEEALAKVFGKDKVITCHK